MIFNKIMLTISNLCNIFYQNTGGEENRGGKRKTLLISTNTTYNSSRIIRSSIWDFLKTGPRLKMLFLDS